MDLLIGCALILYISFDDCLICVLTYRIHIIPTCPKFPSPQNLSYFWVSLHNLLCRQTLYRLDDLLGRKDRDTLNHEMNMILVRADLNKTNLITLADFITYPPQTLLNPSCEDFSAILDWTYKMVQQQVLIVTFEYVLTHTLKLAPSTSSIFNPDAEHRGILFD